MLKANGILACSCGLSFFSIFYLLLSLQLLIDCYCGIVLKVFLLVFVFFSSEKYVFGYSAIELQTFTFTGKKFWAIELIN